MNLSNVAVELLASLRSYAETEFTESDGSVWHSVYLDNVRPKELTNRQFAGYLAALEKAGVYKTYDGEFFGLVKA